MRSKQTYTGKHTLKSHRNNHDKHFKSGKLTKIVRKASWRVLRISSDRWRVDRVIQYGDGLPRYNWWAIGAAWSCFGRASELDLCDAKALMKDRRYVWGIVLSYAGGGSPNRFWQRRSQCACSMWRAMYCPWSSETVERRALPIYNDELDGCVLFRIKNWIFNVIFFCFQVNIEGV